MNAALRLLIAACLTCGLFLSPASADERMAGTPPGGQNQTESSAPIDQVDMTDEKKTENTAKDESGNAESGDETVTSISGEDPSDIESKGSLKSSDAGGLGPDLWRGMRRDEVKELIRITPGSLPYRTLQDLVLRTLVSAGETGLYDSSRPVEAGGDLFTARLEKLLTDGLYTEAADLYKQAGDDSMGESAARNGILALMLSRQTSLACLEHKARENSDSNNTFWDEFSSLCGYFLSGKIDESSRFKSEILQRAVKSKDYAFAPANPSDFEPLSHLEKAFLFADGRISYSRFVPGKPADISPGLLVSLIADPRLPEDMRLNLVSYAVKTGMISTKKLAEFYKAEDFSDFRKSAASSPEAGEKLGTWRKLAWLHFLTDRNESADIRHDSLVAALRLAETVPLPLLYPFASYTVVKSPEDFPQDLIRSSFRLIAESGQTIPPSWQKKWLSVVSAENKDINSKDLNLWLAVALGDTAAHKTAAGNQLFPLANRGFSQNQADILKISYEKLDTGDKLHNYTASELYGNNMGLTFAYDYVMPSISLMDRLHSARTEKRRGEVVLLSALALQEAPPEKLYPGLLREVVEGLTAVGLTKEARRLAQEAILGFDKKGE